MRILLAQVKDDRTPPCAQKRATPRNRQASMCRDLVLGLFATLITLFAANIASAQLMINKGAVIVTKPNSVVQVNGAYQNASGSIDDSGTVTITTDFSNNSTATAGGSGLYYIGGDFTNDGTFVRKTGTVALNGNTNQNVGGSAITTFYNLRLTDGGSKTLTQKEIVDSNCWFVSGICYTTNTDVLNFTTNGEWVDGSSTSYVDGPCEKDFAFATEWRFPVGKDSRFNTCAIEPTSATPTTFRTEYFNFPYVNTTSMIAPLMGVSKIHYWHGDVISGTADAKIKLYWIPGDYTSATYMSTPSNLVVARWNIPLAGWETAGVNALRSAPPADYNSGWIQSATVLSSNFGTSVTSQPFTIGTLTADNSLPVELANFNVRQVTNAVQLNWETYSEIDNLGFEIERRRVGGDPILIKSYERDTALLAKSPWGAHYQTFDDDALVPGSYSYELFQRDLNGHRERVASRTIEISSVPIPEKLSVSVYPNPVIHAARYQLALPVNSHVLVQLLDITGKSLGSLLDLDMVAGEHLLPLDVSDLPSGSYRLVVLAGNERAFTTVIVTK